MCTWILVSDTKDDKHEALASAGAKSQPIFVPALLECFPSFRCDGMAYEVRGKRWQCAGSRSCKSNRFTSLAKNTPSSLRRVRSSRRGGGAIESKSTATSRRPTSVWHAGDKYHGRIFPFAMGAPEYHET